MMKLLWNYEIMKKWNYEIMKLAMIRNKILEADTEEK